MKIKDWLLLIAGVLVMTLAFGALLEIDAQTYPQYPAPYTAPLAPDPCATWPQPNWCAPRPWYELSYVIPREQQVQILQLAVPAVIGAYGLQYPVYPSIDVERARREIRRPVRRISPRRHRGH